LACKVIGTGTINVTYKDGIVHALNAVEYISKARNNLISIRVLDLERCQIQVQHEIVTVNQGDKVIVKGEKCEKIYKLKEVTQFKVEFQC